MGDRAAQQRYRLRAAKTETDRVKPIEDVLSTSLSQYEITKASVLDSRAPGGNFEWHYSLEASSYANTAGDIMTLRPRVIGTKAMAILETKDTREHSIEFEGAELDSDVFAITLPAGYTVESLPAPVDVDDGFAAYHSRTVLDGRTLRYTRTYAIKTPSIPVDQANALRTFYRTITADERNEAILKRTP
jgi:hypothetical protein